MHHGDVDRDAALLAEPLAAVVAFERLDLGVHDLVAPELAHAGKGLVAILALHSVLARKVRGARASCNWRHGRNR